MRPVRLVLLAIAVGLLASAASAETIATMDGQYFKLVPLRGPPPQAQSDVVTIVPAGATASVQQNSSCRLTNFENGEYQPEYTTLCGPP